MAIYKKPPSWKLSEREFVSSYHLLRHFFTQATTINPYFYRCINLISCYLSCYFFTLFVKRAEMLNIQQKYVVVLSLNEAAWIVYFARSISVLVKTSLLLSHHGDDVKLDIDVRWLQRSSSRNRFCDARERHERAFSSVHEHASTRSVWSCHTLMEDSVIPYDSHRVRSTIIAQSRLMFY